MRAVRVTRGRPCSRALESTRNGRNWHSDALCGAGGAEAVNRFAFNRIGRRRVNQCASTFQGPDPDRLVDMNLTASVFVSPARAVKLPAALAVALAAALAIALALGGCAVQRPATGASDGPTAVAASALGAQPATALNTPGVPSGTVTAQPASPPPGSQQPVSPPPGSPAPGSQAPGSPPPFAVVIKGAVQTDGLFTLYQRDEKVWIELKPEDFKRPFFLSPKLATGIGESFVLGGLMGKARVVEFRRVHNLVQLIAVNTEFTARPGTPEGRAVAAAFSPSLLASTPLASQPQPERNSVLVEANALFVNDMLGIGMQLQRAYRQGYAFDARNSAIASVRVKADSVALQVLAHFATGAIAVAQPNMPAGAIPSVPFTLPDPRSLFVTLHYALTPLPVVPMRARAADPRLGHFTATQSDFSDDMARSPTLHHVNRWRLEKADPLAERSAPVRPLVYWLDRTIPLKYRDAISAGILEWNKAFERIGFSDAIRVQVQPEDADFDTLDGGASVRWMTNAEASFGAIGPSHVDPRSGEILAANIGIESLASRARRAVRSEVLIPTTSDYARLMQTGEPAAQGSAVAEPFNLRACLNADQTVEQLGYALDVLAARGEIDPDSPQAQQFVLDALKDMTMHEVGHTLGLRHNFRASRVYSDAQLSDPAFTHDHALTGSVMEYAPVNLAGPGAALVAPFQGALGPYDYWAIEYAYRPINATQERAELARIAARSGEPELAYGTDEDNYLGIDPDTLMFDLGSDPLAFARKRLAIASDLFRRQETRALPPEHDYAVLRRSLGYAINDAARSVGVLARQIGGVRTLRDFPGSGREPLEPVPVSTQRAALDVLSRGLFAADSFVVSAHLQRRLAPDFQERGDLLGRGAGVATDFSLTQRVLGMQRALLYQLMGDTAAARIIDSQGLAGKPTEAFQLTELYATLDRDIWSELSGKGALRDISPPRRDLQREHLNLIAGLVLRPVGLGRADARSLVRANSQTLLARLRGAAKHAALGADTRAHLHDCIATLSQALSARVLRLGV